jgi:hypothetical protein
MAKILNRAILIAGEAKSIDDLVTTVQEFNRTNDIVRDYGATVPSDASAGYAIGCIFALTTGNGTGSTLYINEGSASSCDFNAISSAGGGGGDSLNSAYENGRTIVIDSGAIVHNDATSAAANILEFNKTGAGTGNIIDIDMDAGIAATAVYIDCGAGARTGADIDVKDDSTGTHSVINIASSGSGASTGLAWTDSYNGSDAAFGVKLTLDNTDGLDATAIQIVRGTGVRTVPAIDINEGSTGSANVIDVDVSGVYTGNVIDITTSAAATGNMIFVDLDSAVAGTGLHVEGSGVRTQPMVEVATDATGGANVIDVTITGAISGHAVGISLDTTSTGSAIDIDMNAAVGGIALSVDAGAGTRTADLVTVTFDGDGNADMLAVAHSNTGSGHLFNIDVSGTGSGNVLDVVYSAASTGNAVNLDMTSNLAGNALVVTTAGARTAPVILITGAGTDGGTDDHIIDINQSGLLDSNVIDITYSVAASTGNAIDLNMGTNVAGMAVAVNSAATGVSGEGAVLNAVHTGDLAAGADVVRLDSTGNISSTSNVLSVIQRTGAGTAGAYAVHISATGTNVEALKVDDGAVVFDEVLTVTGLATLTAGIDAAVIFAGIETIAAGGTTTALSLAKSLHSVDSDAGGDIFTLADGTIGQIMTITHLSATGTSTITPANLSGGTSVTFDAAGDSVVLQFVDTEWYILGGNSYTVI